VGDELARRLIFFGERVDAEDAHEMGIVGDVVAHVQLADYAAETAADLAAKPATAMRAAKECLNASNQTGTTGGLAVEARAFSGLFGTPDQREGMDAFLEERDADFE
jgi:enoyl-CoA hydratase/carnithine racemase